MKQTGKTRDRGWQAGVRGTVAVSPGRAWEFLTSPAGMQIWLGARASATFLAAGGHFDDNGTLYRIVSLRKEVLLRLRRSAEEQETTVQLRLQPAAGGTTISLHMEGLQSAAERTTALAEWKEALAKIEAALCGPARRN